jgi:uncharacterized membrane protein
MQTVEKSILINVPVESVFAYWSQPTNHPEVWPSLVEVKDVQPLPDGGLTYQWVYKMAGVRLEGSTETVESVLDERIVLLSKGGIDSKLTYSFQPEDGGTRMSVLVEYTVPVPVLGRLAERVIVKLNEHEAEVTLANLKARLET